MSDTKDGGWRLLDWGYMCDQSPEVHRLFDRDADGREYGTEWWEFINRPEEGPHGQLGEAVQEWWDTVPVERKLKLLRERRKGVAEELAQYDDLIARLEKP